MFFFAKSGPIVFGFLFRKKYAKIIILINKSCFYQIKPFM